MSPYSVDKPKILWWYCRGCSPLPIPNREVKPLMADGTAQQCGRVGSCHIYLKRRSINQNGVFRFVVSSKPLEFDLLLFGILLFASSLPIAIGTEQRS